MKNPSRLYCIASIVLAATLSGCVTHQRSSAATPAPAMPGQITQYQIDKILTDVVYTRTDWAEPLQADLYLPRKAANNTHAVVLMVHGGGWAARQREDMNGISLKLAQHGYAVLNVSYRFAPVYTYPAQLEDLQQALVWLVANADRYSLDIERINVWGYSSGAHLGALLAGQNSVGVTSTGENAELPRIRAVVAGGTPTDLRKYANSGVVSRFIGGTAEELPQLYAQASPVLHVSADDPPVFLYHGKLDLMVTQDQATDYYEALVANGVDAELYLNPWLGHGAMFVFGGDAEAKAIEFLNRKNASIVTGEI